MTFTTTLLSLAFSFLSVSAHATTSQSVSYMEAIFWCGPVIDGQAGVDLNHFDVNIKAQNREYRLPGDALKLVGKNFVLNLDTGVSVVIGKLSEDPTCEVSDRQAHGTWTPIALDKELGLSFTIDNNTRSCDHDAVNANFKRTELYTLQAGNFPAAKSWSEDVTSASPYACEHP